MDQKLYKAAKEGNVSCLSVIDGRNTTEEEAMNNHHGKFLKRTQHGNNNILHIAARAGRDTFVAKTLEHFPFLSDQVNSKGDSPVLVAARFGHLKVVKTLAEPNNDQFRIQDENGTYSSSTPRQGDVEEGPVDHQLDVPIPQYPWRVKNLKQYTTALHEALRNGHQNVARYLLGLDPEMAILVNDAGESPLFLAAESCCQLFMTDILLSNRPYSTKGPHGLNPLHAARHCDGSALECIAGGTIISELIKQNPDLMRKLDDRGKAAIHHAVEADYWVLLDQMLKADPSIALFPDAEGYTALLRASSRGYWKVCERILQVCPESIEARNDKGQHALHLARSRIPAPLGYVGKIPPEMWELVNVGDDEGNTPLHLAVKDNYYTKVISLTSSASINLGAVNEEGLTALDLCESDWKHINRKRLMWFHLRRRGASRGRHPNEQEVPVGGMRQVIRSPNEDMKPFINTLALVAALIATLTFAAAFTMPGGYQSSPDNLVGVATLANKAALKVFVLSDTLAMCFSILTLFLLLTAMTVEQDVSFSLTNTSGLLLGIALYATLVAFICGIFAVIAPKALWVAIVMEFLSHVNLKLYGVLLSG
ncbi:hypothetical protein RHMOL_Rhmol04G0047200 [Rhododendron molle]|uniref:Uncharacterized protein n=1 Tax=Rhododendron molle TaxID=49168 RepID=A0ACC0NXH6_RHOML|nr:hypothetical protein RHMOL_Rhmol04G0047200 [Rhododendron molle]